MANPILQAIRLVIGILFPGVMMTVAASVFLGTALLSPRLLLGLKIGAIQEKSFASLWSVIGPLIANDFPSHLDKILEEHCRGVVLDIGPGSGFQLKRFKASFDNGQIERVYGIEPSTNMHKQLREEAVKVFSDKAAQKYTIVTSGAQPSQLLPALDRYGLGDSSQFDTIVCFRAMCGIPDPQKTAERLYQLLKPGGCLIFLEHVKARKNIWLLFQRLYMLLGWKLWNGGCELTRDTLQTFQAAGGQGWAREEIYAPAGKLLVPEIYGYMIKKP